MLDDCKETVSSGYRGDAGHTNRRFDSMHKTHESPNRPNHNMERTVPHQFPL